MYHISSVSLDIESRGHSTFNTIYLHFMVVLIGACRYPIVIMLIDLGGIAAGFV